MYQNIPEELRVLPQWVCWRYMEQPGKVKPVKLPINPNTNAAADVTDPSTWATFDEAVSASGNHSGIGFVLTEADPYAVIDLDAPTPEQVPRHQAVFDTVETYTELSPSGKGVHLVLIGAVPVGVKRDNIEIYSQARYITFTGNVLRGIPITEHQEILDAMYSQMKSDVSFSTLAETDSSISDEELFYMAEGASNGAKFSALYNGDTSGHPSQSEADLALMSILAFYSPSNEQCRRVFRMSALGQREKATRNDKHLNRMLIIIRAKQPPAIKIDFSKLTTPTPPTDADGTDAYDGTDDCTAEPVQLESTSFPPGLVGDIANYIYASAIRPVPEVALAAALAMTAGIAGRCYNISGTGLNQYLILVASTGVGKEGAATGIETLMSYVRQTVPSSDRFLGPSSFASGQALIKALDERHSFVSVLGEFGLTLQQICDPRAGSHLVMLKKVLLDLYAKSGWDKVLRSSVYADSDKNTKVVKAPNLTILGESTPDRFFGPLEEVHIAEGLIPRFLIIEYKGKRTPKNPNAFHPPSEALIQSVGQLCAIALTMDSNGANCPIPVDNEALALYDAFDSEADSKINHKHSEIESQLWNRAHLKALKLGALIAVGVDPMHPIVTKSTAEWAINFIRSEVVNVVGRFKKGTIGQGDHRLEADTRKAVTTYFDMTEAQKQKGYKVPKTLLDKPVVPYVYLRRRLCSLSSFKNDKRGATRALAETLKDLVRAEILTLVPASQAFTEFGTRSDVYIKGESW